MDVNAMLGVGGDVGYGNPKKSGEGGGSGWGGGQDGCERKIEVFEKIPKKKIRGGGRGRVAGVFGLGGQGGCEFAKL